MITAHKNLPGNGRLPAFLFKAPLLSKAEERNLFSRMRDLNSRAEASTDARRIRRYQREVLALRNRIVEANLRLAVSIAGRFSNQNRPVDELLSEATPILIRAVELFDVESGNAFSTYATNAVRNHFLRVRARDAKRRSRFPLVPGDDLQTVPDNRTPPIDADTFVLKQKQTVESLLDELSPRERRIVSARFGLSDGRGRSYRDIADSLRLSKERVRVIARTAVDRLQAAAKRQRLEHPEVLA